MFIAAPEDTADTAQLYKSNADSQGFVMNLTRAWAWRPDVFEGFAALRSQLTTKSSLSNREQAVIVCATAAGLGDSYCSLAWGKKLAAEAGAELAAAVIGASEHDGLNARDQALADWARKVVTNPNGTLPQDVNALQAAGFTEKEIFEATVFIAFRLAFSTVNDALGVKPDWELAESVPKEVGAAVTFGRPAATKPR
ncbi:MAG: hypothetical protein ABI648_10780 [Betaproteobacteria bacterium]|jgi:uncharacterized peroxidase-related enzyme